MSDREQAQAVALLTAALRVLTDEHATPQEQARVAMSINTFLMMKPADPPPAGAGG